MLWLRGAIYDVIGCIDLVVGGGTLWSVGTGDYRFFARWLPGVDSAWFCRRRPGYVVGSSDGSTGALCGADRYDQLSDRVVHHRLCTVRRGDRVADKKSRLN